MSWKPTEKRRTSAAKEKVDVFGESRSEQQERHNSGLEEMAVSCDGIEKLLISQNKKKENCFLH